MTKAILEIEMRYDNINQYLKLCKKITAEITTDSMATALWGGMPYPVWVAEIQGISQKFGYERKFIRYKKDYSRSNSKGSRGVYAVYLLEEGKLYDVKAWKERYFCTVRDWQVVRMDKSEVDEWLNDRLASMF